MLDFSVERPDVDLSAVTDDELEDMLHLPLRKSRPADRISRHANCYWSKFGHPDRMKLCRAILHAMQSLATSDLLTEEAINDLDATAEISVVHFKGFRQAHHDWDTTIYHERLFFEPISNTGKRVQMVNLRDDGMGSTGKGTTRAMSDGFLGLHTGDADKGYSSVLSQGVFDIQTGTPPAEKLANLAGCKHSWMDDFDVERHINNAALREVTGGNTLAPERKHRQASAFVYEGQIFACCNGNIRFTHPLIGADVRRLAGIDFVRRYADNPEGPNELLKDNRVKETLKTSHDELLFLTLCFWLAKPPRPSTDTTQPQPPNALTLQRATIELSNQSVFASGELDLSELLNEFICSELQVYELVVEAKPSSALQIDEEFCAYCLRNHSDFITANVIKGRARGEFRKIYKYVAGFHLKAVGSRKKSSVNVYVNDRGDPMTLKPAP